MLSRVDAGVGASSRNTGVRTSGIWEVVASERHGRMWPVFTRLRGSTCHVVVADPKDRGRHRAKRS